MRFPAEIDEKTPGRSGAWHLQRQRSRTEKAGGKPPAHSMQCVSRYSGQERIGSICLPSYAARMVSSSLP